METKEDTTRKTYTFSLTEAELAMVEKLTYAAMHGTNRSAWLQGIVKREGRKLEQSQKKGAK